MRAGATRQCGVMAHDFGCIPFEEVDLQDSGCTPDYANGVVQVSVEGHARGARHVDHGLVSACLRGQPANVARVNEGPSRREGTLGGRALQNLVDGTTYNLGPRFLGAPYTARMMATPCGRSIS